MVQAISAPRQINVIASSLPSWIPSAGQVGIVPMLNTFSRITGSGLPHVDPCPDKNCFFNSNFNGTGNHMVMDAESGGIAAPDWGTHGGIAISGGGHGDYGGNEVYMFDPMSGPLGIGPQFIRLLEPTNLPSVGTFNSIADDHWGEFEDGQPASHHSYDNWVMIPPSLGGGPKGSFFAPCANAVGLENFGGVKRGHFVDLNDLTTKWQRYPSVNQAPETNVGPTGATCHDTFRDRVWQVASGSNGSIGVLDRTTNVWSLHTGPAYQATGSQGVTLHYSEARDVIIAISISQIVANGIKIYRATNTGDAEFGWTQVTLTGDSFPTAGFINSANVRNHGANICTANGKLYMYYTLDQTAFYEITIGTPVTGPWTLTRIPLQGPAAAVTAWAKAFEAINPGQASSASKPRGFKRFAWMEKIGCYVWPVCGKPNAIIGQTFNQLVLCFKPPGT